jgi:hypothetical protein
VPHKAAQCTVLCQYDRVQCTSSNIRQSCAASAVHCTVLCQSNRAVHATETVPFSRMPLLTKSDRDSTAICSADWYWTMLGLFLSTPGSPDTYESMCRCVMEKGGSGGCRASSSQAFSAADFAAAILHLKASETRASPANARERSLGRSLLCRSLALG